MEETLQREIDEKRAILDGVDEDVESRRKIMEYAQMKTEMRKRNWSRRSQEDSSMFSTA
jgi:hypothetical protein